MSGKKENRKYNLAGAIDATVDSGVTSGAELVEFAHAVVAGGAPAVAEARGRLVSAAGSGAVVTAAATAANFSMLDRIANAIGIPLDDKMVGPSADIRESLGLNAYPSAANTNIVPPPGDRQT